MNEEFKWKNQKWWVKGWICFFAITFPIGMFGMCMEKIENRTKDRDRDRVVTQKDVVRPEIALAKPNAHLYVNMVRHYMALHDKAVNDIQKSRIMNELKKREVGFKAVSWYGRISKIDSWGEVKIVTGRQLPDFYFKISEGTRKIENWEVGDFVRFDGKIGKCAFFSHKIKIYKIVRYDRDISDYERKILQKQFTEYIIKNLDLYYGAYKHRDESYSVDVQKSLDGTYTVYRGLMLNSYREDGSIRGRRFQAFDALYKKTGKNSFKLIYIKKSSL